MTSIRAWSGGERASCPANLLNNPPAGKIRPLKELAGNRKYGGNAALQHALMRAGHVGNIGNKGRLAMRMYNSDELDVMAEAYLKALAKLPVASPTIELTQRLVEEIGAAFANGIRDEDELAAAAVERSNLRPDL
jgi:hypothetical protein